ncbi:MAG: Hsp20/alpha crystallin family protein [Bacteroidia bacterium]|nr:Hsp20/alpha crystallin family protein [Bacteroidia bacterium]
MIRRSHSIKERLGNRLLGGQELLSRGGNLSGSRSKHYAFSPEEVQFSGPHHEVRLPLPNIEREELEVTAINGMLLVKGSSVDEEQMGDHEYLLNEKNIWRFETVFDLNPRVDVERITAKFIHNELILRLFLCEGEEVCGTITRQIPIK